MEDYVCLRVLRWWLRLSPCSYFWISAEPTAVCAECRCSTRLITPERITPLLRELHWLRVSERIQFRLYLLEYHWVHITAPAYLTESSHMSDNTGRRPSPSALGRHHDAAGATITSYNPERPAAAARAWNNLLPQMTTDTLSLSLTFRRDSSVLSAFHDLIRQLSTG